MLATYLIDYFNLKLNSLLLKITIAYVVINFTIVAMTLNFINVLSSVEFT